MNELITATKQRDIKILNFCKNIAHDNSHDCRSEKFKTLVELTNPEHLVMLNPTKYYSKINIITSLFFYGDVTTLKFFSEKYPKLKHEKVNCFKLFEHLLNNSKFEMIEYIIGNNFYTFEINCEMQYYDGQFMDEDYVSDSSSEDYEPTSIRYGNYFITKACKNNRTDIVEFLIHLNKTYGDYNLDIDCYYYEDLSYDIYFERFAPLVLACKNGNLEIISLLLKEFDIDVKEHYDMIKYNCKNVEAIELIDKFIEEMDCKQMR